MKRSASSDNPGRKTSVAQRTQLAAWLQEWYVSRILVDADDPGDADTETVAFSSATVYDAPPTLVTGAILLMKPLSRVPHGPCVRPLYVALLAHDNAEGWHVAPFGRFAVPATPREFQTGLRPMALRVLCLWNARRVSRAILARSWRVGRLPSHVLALALRDGEPVTASSIRPRLRWRTPAEKVGPPLTHPLDPRWIYLREEADFVCEALSNGVTTGEKPEPSSMGESTHQCRGVLKAAESRRPYGTGNVRR